MDRGFSDPETTGELVVSAHSDAVDELVRRRLAAGLTQGQIAKLMGITESRMLELEAGRRQPHIATLQKYAKILEEL